LRSHRRHSRDRKTKSGQPRLASVVRSAVSASSIRCSTTLIARLAPRHRCRTAPRRARGMEPTVRNPRIESAIGSEAARSPLLGRPNSRAPAGQLPSEIQSPGTEFLDAETGGQESTRGSLVPLLRAYKLEPVEVHAVFPGGPRPSIKVRAQASAWHSPGMPTPCARRRSNNHLPRSSSQRSETAMRTWKPAMGTRSNPAIAANSLTTAPPF